MLIIQFTEILNVNSILGLQQVSITQTAKTTTVLLIMHINHGTNNNAHYSKVQFCTQHTQKPEMLIRQT